MYKLSCMSIGCSCTHMTMKTSYKSIQRFIFIQIELFPFPRTIKPVVHRVEAVRFKSGAAL